MSLRELNKITSIEEFFIYDTLPLNNILYTKDLKETTMTLIDIFSITSSISTSIFNVIVIEFIDTTLPPIIISLVLESDYQQLLNKKDEFKSIVLYCLSS